MSSKPPSASMLFKGISEEERKRLAFKQSLGIIRSATSVLAANCSVIQGLASDVHSNFPKPTKYYEGLASQVIIIAQSLEQQATRLDELLKDQTTMASNKAEITQLTTGILKLIDELVEITPIVAVPDSTSGFIRANRFNWATFTLSITARQVIPSARKELEADVERSMKRANTSLDLTAPPPGLTPTSEGSSTSTTPTPDSKPPSPFHG